MSDIRLKVYTRLSIFTFSFMGLVSMSVLQKSVVWCNSDFHKSANGDARLKDTGLIYAKFTKLHNDRFIYERLQCLSCLFEALPGFTVALQSHCVPGCPPVSQWLEHSGSVCQLVDICLLPPPSVVMAANPPLSPPPPRWPAFSTLLSCFPRTPAVNH